MTTTTGVRHLDISLKGIGEALAHSYLVVPRYQRAYAWKDENVRDLYQDLSAAIAQDEPEYFLGSLVLSHRHDDKAEVVDGQQRLATATMLLVAIRDWFAESGDANRAEDVERNYLVMRDIVTQERVPKLTLNTYDHDFFQKATLSPVGDPARQVQPVRESHDRIASAYKIAVAHVTKIASTTNAPTEQLLAFVTYLSKRARVICVAVPDHANAFVIFETLNDRGLDLSLADLLKNYLFGRADGRIAEAQDSWSAMVGALDAVGGEEVTLTYIRHLWSSLYGPTREKVLYGEIKKKITSKQKAIDFSVQLEKSAKSYAAILNPHHELWQKYGVSARQHVETLMQLKLEQFRPLLLAILDIFPGKEIVKSLRYLLSCSVRFLVVGGLGGGTMERVYAEAAVAARGGEILSAKNLSNNLAKYVPSDKEFEEAFISARVSQAYLARYYLYALERKMQGEDQPEFVPNQNAEEVTLEHVLPENPSAAWGAIDPDVARAHFKRIGNLTLLRSKLNSSIGNAGFSEKKKIFKKSEFKLTQMIARKGDWSVDHIAARQVELAKIAVSTWPIRVS